ncbi:type II toxin-antitoxin system VapC family toxin [Prosthecomicrobium pneumaticum]|uniref:Ribonuclease VapC n=1 Tax=Prosthecomicrobium pneumaticum TaxID=81895 RepID=A0A7W9CV99_9HYPH|nr:type II toxin-antitoxin system VapC family toxin [Prosthecomicrobium pneumaticum]MBB5752151.1 PIN domain nuclease of toxin-antitoxin system [Prosthecomicrobium pneumaticum]
MAVVLDASAVIAALLGERGGEVIDAYSETAALATVNLSEAVSALADHGFAPETAFALIVETRVEIVPFDAQLALDAAAMKPLTRRAGLSLGDRACLALARRRGLAAITADRAWSAVADAVGVEIILIR